MDFFIDESGNSGDLVHAGPRLDFDGQPIFPLTAVGVPDADAAGAAVAIISRRPDLLHGAHDAASGVLIRDMAQPCPVWLNI